MRPRYTLVLFLCFAFALCASASAQTYTLGGKVTDSAGHAVPSARVSAKSLASRHLFHAETNADGMYSISGLAAGDYQVWAVAGELKAQTVKVTLAAAQTTDLVVEPDPKRHPKASEHPPEP